MGKPLPQTANPATGVPPAGDQANGVVTGQFTASGQCSQPFCFYGALDISMWGQTTANLTVTANPVGTPTLGVGTVASGTGVGNGQSINSKLLPPGAVAVMGTTNVGSITTVQIGGLSATQLTAVVVGNDAAAIFVGTGNVVDMIVQLERTFDGGTTWIPAGIGGAGTPAIYQFGASFINAPVSFVAAEPEKGVAYRLHCTQYTDGTLNYRLSATGLAAMTWGIPVG